MPKSNILILSRQTDSRSALAERLNGLGHHVCNHANADALDGSASRIDVVVVDDWSHLDEINKRFPQPSPAVLLVSPPDAPTTDYPDDGHAPHVFLAHDAEESVLASQIDLAVRCSRVESRLQGSERAFRTLATCLPEAVFRADLSGRILYVNQRAVELFGLPRPSLIGRTPAEAGLPPDFANAWESLVAAIPRPQTPSRLLVEPRAGSRFYEINASLEAGPDGSPAAILATVRDTSGFQQLLDQHSRISARLLHHLDRSPLAVMEWDADGAILTWNPRATEIFEWRADEIEPGTDCLLKVVHPSDRQAFAGILRKLAAGLDERAFTACRGLRRDGTTIHCEWHLSAHPDARGAIASIMCLVHETTARKKAEQAMRHARQELENRLLEKTAMLARCREELEFLRSSCSSLESDIVRVIEREQRRIGQDLHDGICQELAGIRLSLEALLDGGRDLGEPVRDTLRRTVDAVQRVSHHTRLVSRGLAPACIQDGDLAGALSEFAANLKNLFGVSCKLSIDGNDPLLDEHKATHLFRITQEAVQNAIKHGGADGVAIALDACSSPGRLVVEDNGDGLAEGVGPSEGMGLRIMKRRASLIDGDVVVESGPAGGVRVTCEFPR
jgi:PAS domain S-box-containing protein